MAAGPAGQSVGKKKKDRKKVIMSGGRVIWLLYINQAQEIQGRQWPVCFTRGPAPPPSLPCHLPLPLASVANPAGGDDARSTTVQTLPSQRPHKRNTFELTDKVELERVLSGTFGRGGEKTYALKRGDALRVSVGREMFRAFCISVFWQHSPRLMQALGRCQVLPITPPPPPPPG